MIENSIVNKKLWHFSDPLASGPIWPTHKGIRKIHQHCYTLQANPRVVDRQGHSYYVPNRLRHCTSPKTLYLSSNSDVVFYLDFNGFLPGQKICKI